MVNRINTGLQRFINEYERMKTTTSQCKVSAKTRLGTTIFRRSKKGSWSYATKRKGKYYLFPLGYDLSQAKAEADRIRGKLMVDDPEKVRLEVCQKVISHARAPVPTIQEVMDRLRKIKNVKNWQDSTLRDYVGSVGSIPRIALGVSREKVLKMPANVLTPDLLVTYRDEKLKDVTEAKARKSVMRTINGNIRALKAVFSADNEIHFKDYDIRFAEDLRKEKFYKGLKKQYKFPPSEMVNAVFDLAENLKGDQKTALNLALHFGLRRNEIFHIRRDWFDTRHKYCRIDIAAEREFFPKGGHEGMTVGDQAIGKKILNEALGDDYLLGYRFDKGRKLFEAIIAQLKKIGFNAANDRKSPMHEMRKLYGSYISTTQSLYTAQKYLRHADASTTNESYADIIVDDHIISRWAA